MYSSISALRLVSLLAVALTASSAPAVAQHAHDDASVPSGQHQHGAAAPGTDLFPSLEASGTAWLPDETPMYGIPRTLGGWDVMLHGTAFGQYLYEPGETHRTGGFSTHQVSSVNWLMAMARRRVGTGRVGLRAMASIEPWSVRDCGFINLLATGET
jgi:hypothetical protein